MSYAANRRQPLYFHVVAAIVGASLIARNVATELDCDEYFSVAESWQPSFDRFKVDDYMFYGFSAQRADEAPFLMRDSTGLHLRPSLDVRLNRIPPCVFKGNLWLATNPNCNKNERDKTEVKEIEGSSFEGNERRWQLTFTESQMLMEGSHTTHFRDFKVHDLDLKMYLCVQPGPETSREQELAIKRPLHMVWYFQSSDSDRITDAYKLEGAPKGWHVAFSERGEHGTSETSDLPAYSHVLRYFWQDDSHAAANAQEWMRNGAVDNVPVPGSGHRSARWPAFFLSLSAVAILCLL